MPYVGKRYGDDGIEEAFDALNATSGLLLRDVDELEEFKQWLKESL